MRERFGAKTFAEWRVQLAENAVVTASTELATARDALLDLRDKVEASLKQKNQLLVKVYNQMAVDADEVADHLLSFADRIHVQ